MDSRSTITQATVEINKLSRNFGTNKALKQVSLTIEKGKVYGLVGENGAGKSTLIKHILGLYKAQQGLVNVFGLDPVRSPKEVLQNIGYVSEEPELPSWMRIHEYLRYMKAFYPNWDDAYSDQLVVDYKLDIQRKLGELSKGQRARTALVAAQSHRPELLLLDEPSSGLDPVVRQDILSAALRTARNDDRTVLFSSHLLEEVENVSDHLIMIKLGQVLLSEPMSKILSDHHQLVVQGIKKKSQIQKISNVFAIKKVKGSLQLNCFADIEKLKKQCDEEQIELIEHRPLTLNEVFLLRSQKLQSLSSMN